MPHYAWAKEPNGFLKITSFLLSTIGQIIFCLNPLLEHKHPARLMVLTTSSTFAVLLYYIIAYFIDHARPGDCPVTDLIFLVIHGVLSLTAGGIAIKYYEWGGYGSHVLVFGVITIMVGILLLADGYYTYKEWREEAVQTE